MALSPGIIFDIFCVIGVLYVSTRTIHGQVAVSPEFSDCKIDVALVIDASGSIRDKNVPGQPDNWFTLLKFMGDLISQLPVGPDTVRVAVVVFSNEAEVVFNLDEFSDTQSMIQATNGIVYVGGNTNTTGGLRAMRREVFTPLYGDRRDVENIAIVITDGEPTIEKEGLSVEVLNNKQRGTHMIAVGVTNGIDDRLKSVASWPEDDNYFHEDDFMALESISTAILNTACVLHASPSPDVQPGVGNTGATGATGRTGPSGPTGFNGQNGLPGETGATGPVGPAGLPGSGATGRPGPTGDPGATGARGDPGFPGPFGPLGPVGSPGFPGNDGPAGATGASGPPGPSGASGPAGPTGFPGSPGPAGATGPSGFPGYNGQKGDPGNDGLQGRPGAKGESGTTGFPGNPGPSGPHGSPGNPGDKGSQGFPGATGSPGPTGQRGSPGFLGPVGPLGPSGPQGRPGTSGANGVPGIAGAPGSKGDPGVGQPGPSGDPGQPGTPGSNGINGATGVTGYPGAAGPKGDAGPPGALGSPGFNGKTGATGWPGAAGQPGNPGGTGATGALGPGGAPGNRGPTGPAGQPGSQGPFGAPGSAGATGASGAPGVLGLTGRTGATGFTGQPGNPGYNGATGFTGPAGPPGYTGNPGPSGINGLHGRTGATGLTGSTGPAGWSGPPGATGSPGQPGPPGQAAENEVWTNECMYGNGGCSQVCVDTYDSFYCACHTGYRVVNVRWFCDSTSLYCRNTPDAGWQCFCMDVTPPRPINGTQCSSVNECEVLNGGCQQQCVDTGDSYYCICGTGYRISFDTASCDDIDECQDPALCANSVFGLDVLCVNTYGSYFCLPVVDANGYLGQSGDEEPSSSDFQSLGVLIGVAVGCAVTVFILGLLAYRGVERWRAAARDDTPSHTPDAKITAWTGDSDPFGFNSISAKLRGRHAGQQPASEDTDYHSAYSVETISTDDSHL